jgi:choline dehydrogenase
MRLTRKSISSSYDYVIVGGGSAGCVLAARLSEDGSARVLLLEAGGNDLNPFIRVPAGVKQITARYDYQYEVEPDPTRGGVVDHWASGRVIGGGSSVNAMLWVRGHPADFDSWAKSGATGWDYASVLPYFIRTETFEDGGDETRGHRGPLHVSNVRLNHLMTDTFVRAGQELGHPANPDYNGRTQPGSVYAQANQRRGWRSSTARAYLAPARRRDNLDVALNATVHRVRLQGNRATGVECVVAGQLVSIRAEREVILSAGAFASPRLLQLSGIGPEDELRQHGISVVAANPGVGVNLQEHPLTVLLHRVNVRTLNQELTIGRVVRHGWDFVRRGRGAVTSPAAHALLLAQSPVRGEASWFQAMFSPFGVIGKPSANKKADASGEISHDVHAMQLLRESSLTTYPCLLHPRARGTVRLRSGNPADPPAIRHDLLANPDDLADLREAARETRALFDTAAFRPYVEEELRPGVAVRSDDDWADYLRTNTFRSNHPVGTARMGSDDEAAVDPNLRVRGVDNLRVVDASVMPTLPSGNTNAATIMIAERAADLIRNRQPAAVSSQSALDEATSAS